MSTAEPLPTSPRTISPPAPLGGQDLAFLAWESRERPMHFSVVARFRLPRGARAPDIERLRATLAPRVLEEPLLVSRLRNRGLRHPVWTPAPPIDFDHHVRCASALRRAGESRSAARDRILAAPLDPSRPLWEIWLEPDEADAEVFVLLIKLHHVLIDGIAGVALLERLIGGLDGVAQPVDPNGGRKTPQRGSLGQALRFAIDLCRAGPRTPLNGRVAIARRHAQLEVDGKIFKHARARWGVSGNDLLLAAVAGALRLWLMQHGSGMPPPALRAFVPVSLRTRRERGASGNRIAPWLVTLPVEEGERSARVQAIREKTRERRHSGATSGGAGMSRWIERLGRWLAALGMAIAAWRRGFGLVVTNLPGPNRPLQLLGARLETLHAHPPLFPGQRLAVAVIHYEGRLCLGVNHGFSDTQLGHAFTAALAQELDALLESRSVAAESGSRAAADDDARSPGTA